MRAKVRSEGACRLCGAIHGLDPAHVIQRARVSADADSVDNVIALCRQCHNAYDERRVSILEVLHTEEQAAAVIAAKGLVAALERTTNQKWRPAA